MREEKGWTQQQAADAFHVSRSGYIKWERSERRLRVDIASRAARVYEVPTSAVIGDDMVDDLPESLTPELVELFARIPGTLNEAEFRALEAQIDLYVQSHTARNAGNQGNGSQPEG